MGSSVLTEQEQKILNARRKDVISEKRLFQRLGHIQGCIEDLWADNPDLPWFTFHGPRHSYNVEMMLYKLIPSNRRSKLSEDEWYHLLVSAWLHDVGMIYPLLKKDRRDLLGNPDRRDEMFEEFRRVRMNHHERTDVYLQIKGRDLGLRVNDVPVVKQVCRFHRKNLDIRTCRAEMRGLRTRLLAAYLRLGDALHLDSTRVDEARYRLLRMLGMPLESRFHWQKSKWIVRVCPKPSEATIYADVYDTPAHTMTHGLLEQLVRDEIQEELDSVKDVLVQSMVSFFLEVKVERFAEPANSDELFELEMTLSNIVLENLSSASEAADTVIATILRFTEGGDADAVVAIKNYLYQGSEVLKNRPCHILIQSVLTDVKRIVENDRLTDEQRVERVKAVLEEKKQTREDCRFALVENARPFLQDCGSILLYGYSNLVLSAMGALSPKEKKITQVYIAECRGKTQYGHGNQLRYCDGQKYALEVRRRGFERITMVPDIVVGSLMFQKLIKKVVFGANGIGANDGSFGHTAGHLAVADLASVYSVPVYVIADISKVGELHWHKELNRDVQWLTGDRRALREIAECGIKMMNPREDWVAGDRVAMLITEYGAFPPAEVPHVMARLSLKN